mgnify:CR=1 FL=1
MSAPLHDPLFVHPNAPAGAPTPRASVSREPMALEAVRLRGGAMGLDGVVSSGVEGDGDGDGGRRGGMERIEPRPAAAAALLAFRPEAADDDNDDEEALIDIGVDLVDGSSEREIYIFLLSLFNSKERERDEQSERERKNATQDFEREKIKPEK